MKAAPTQVLLVSDIDDTLTGDSEALQRLVKLVEAHRARLSMAVNSSRPGPSVLQTLRDDFPGGFQPVGMITAMGTEVRVHGEVDTAWQARFAGWPRDRIDGLLRSLGHKAHDPAFQTSYKVSFARPQRPRAAGGRVGASSSSVAVPVDCLGRR